MGDAQGVHGRRRRSGRRRGRHFAIGALILAVAAITAVLLTRDTSHGYRFVFESAGQLVDGDIVRIGGNPAGEVTGIELTPDSQAEVQVSIDDEFAPLHGGTTATIRAQGLIGVASRYVDVSPGPDFRDKLEDGAVLSADNTTSIVEVDQLFNALDPKTRQGLERVIEGSADWYEGRERLANLSAAYFAPALVATKNLVDEVDRDSSAFERFLVETADALGTLADRRGELTELVGNAGATARAVASDTGSLERALSELPPGLRQGSETFAALHPALDDLERLVAETGPASDDLVPFLRRLRPVLERATPTFKELRLIFGRSGRRTTSTTRWWTCPLSPGSPSAASRAPVARCANRHRCSASSAPTSPT